MSTPQIALTGHNLEAFVVRGDLSVLDANAKSAYYIGLCSNVGLDPATKPFEFLKLNGREILYATKGAAEQLRRKHGIAITIKARERVDDVYSVTACATLPDGRTDESIGAVSVSGLKGDALANAIMKSETKAKRRVTLSALGLGMLDESELETIPRHAIEVVNAATDAKQLQPKPAQKVVETPPEKITVLPAELMIRQLAPLAGKNISELSVEDLELLEEASVEFERSAKTETGRTWFAKIHSAAAAQLIRREDVAP